MSTPMQFVSTPLDSGKAIEVSADPSKSRYLLLSIILNRATDENQRANPVALGVLLFLVSWEL
jgi:hypothetical protein